MKTFYDNLREVWHDPTMPGYSQDVSTSDYEKWRNQQPLNRQATPKKAPAIASFFPQLSTGGGRKNFEQGITNALPTASMEALVKAHRILMRGQMPSGEEETLK